MKLLTLYIIPRLALFASTLTIILSGSPPLSHAVSASTNSSIALPDGTRHILQTPAGLHVSLYATGLPSARFMALGPQGEVFVGSWSAGTVSVLRTRQSTSKPLQPTVLLRDLLVPHSIVYHKGRLYVGEETQVRSWKYDPATLRVSDPQIVVSALPTGGRHVTRTISFGPDDHLYVSVGSSCNECVDAANRAIISRYRADGSSGAVYARGLRNAVGIAWQPATSQLWVTDNGEDSLGDAAPPDEVNRISQNGDYGWPYCWGNGKKDPSVASSATYCSRTINPLVSLPAHSAPLGLAFSTGSQLPAHYRGGLFVAYHGSMYRSQPTGYKVVYIPINGSRLGSPEDVITGWISSSNIWGRPVGILMASDGSVLISDDQAGVIYRLST